MSSDRLKDPISAVVAGMLPRVSYFGLYRATVVRESVRSDGSMIVDVLPDDPSIPQMSGVRLKLGLPATSVQIATPAHVGIGWEGGDPSKPFAATWDGGEPDAIEMVIRAAQIFLGAKIGAEPTIMGATYRAAEATSNAAIVSAMGGVAAALAVFVADPTTIAFTSTFPGASSLLSAIGVACAAVSGAVSGFEAGAPAYVSPRARVA